jgi:hypothetical protein
VPSLPEGATVATVCEASAVLAGANVASLCGAPAAPVAVAPTPVVAAPAAAVDGTLLLDARGTYMGERRQTTQEFTLSADTSVVICWELEGQQESNGSFFRLERRRPGEQGFNINQGWNFVESSNCSDRELGAGTYRFEIDPGHATWRITVRVR